MKAFFKGKITDGRLSIIPDTNRAFLYGDGFFETMIALNGHVKFLVEHIERISNALHHLEINPPKDFNVNKLQKMISNLHLSDSSPEFAKVKLIAWRKDGGTYSPEKHEGEYILTFKEIPAPVTHEIINVSFSESIKNVHSSISGLKSTSALQYVVAGLEKKKKALQEIIILDQYGNISECLTSNIFWTKGDVVYTPSLKTGCINGISRRIILNELENRSIKHHEVKADISEILEAESVFTTNATGITHVLQIDDKPFKKYSLIEEIYQPY